MHDHSQIVTITIKRNGDTEVQLRSDSGQAIEPTEPAERRAKLGEWIKTAASAIAVFVRSLF